MPLAGLELAIVASERPQTHGLDRTTAGTDNQRCTERLCGSPRKTSGRDETWYTLDIGVYNVMLWLQGPIGLHCVTCSVTWWQKYFLIFPPQ